MRAANDDRAKLAHLGLGGVTLHPAQRQVRVEGSRLGGETQGRHLGLNGIAQTHQGACRILQPDPDHPRLPGIGKTAQATDRKAKRADLGGGLRKRILDCPHLLSGRIAQKLERQVDASGCTQRTLRGATCSRRPSCTRCSSAFSSWSNSMAMKVRRIGIHRPFSALAQQEPVTQDVPLILCRTLPKLEHPPGIAAQHAPQGGGGHPRGLHPPDETRRRDQGIVGGKKHLAGRPAGRQ